VDYVTVRADGRIDLDIKAEITTDDGEKIAFAASGVGIPQPGLASSYFKPGPRVLLLV
jgi:hypothetical protein